MFSERDLDAMDHARDQQKERDLETRCRSNVTLPSGVLTGCYLERGHDGACVSRFRFGEVQHLLALRRSLLNEMRRERDTTAREVLRAQVAVLDVEIAEVRR